MTRLTLIILIIVATPLFLYCAGFHGLLRIYWKVLRSILLFCICLVGLIIFTCKCYIEFKWPIIDEKLHLLSVRFLIDAIVLRMKVKKYFKVHGFKPMLKETNKKTESLHWFEEDIFANLNLVARRFISSRFRFALFTLLYIFVLLMLVIIVYFLK